MDWQERLIAGKNFEKEIQQRLIDAKVVFKSQVYYKTTLGNYIADFVLENGVIIETTLGNLEKFAKHPFAVKKLAKLKILIDSGIKIVIVSPYASQWASSLSCEAIHPDNLEEYFKQ